MECPLSLIFMVVSIKPDKKIRSVSNLIIYLHITERQKHVYSNIVYKKFITNHQ